MFAFSGAAYAEDGNGNNPQGAYAFQFTGTISLTGIDPQFNGPFYRNGRVVFDGKGKFQVTSMVANYNGNVSSATFGGTYTVTPEGVFHMIVQNLPVPFLPPYVPNIFAFDGVLADNGKLAKVVLSGVNVGGVQLPNIGSVIAGEFVKQ